MKPTDVKNPSYFHKVVDCQWACPAHTNVPEYIRLIAQGQYTDAYMLNRESQRVPGHPRAHLRSPVRAGLPAHARRREAGRDLPAEARRRRSARRRQRPAARDPDEEERQARRLHRRRAAPRSTVANDLAPLGYEVVIFEQLRRAGRPHAHEHADVPAAARGARRGDRDDPRHGRRDPLQHAGRRA